MLEDALFFVGGAVTAIVVVFGAVLYAMLQVDPLEYKGD